MGIPGRCEQTILTTESLATGVQVIMVGAEMSVGSVQVAEGVLPLEFLGE